jgi:DNA-binding response OmpR family regulator
MKPVKLTGGSISKRSVPPRSPAGKAVKRVLLVDDDASVRDSLACALAEERYEVLPAADGPEALRIAAAVTVDIVLLDLNMPRQNGWDTFERLTYDHPLVPIIVVTARPNQLFTALAAGAGALVEKPVHIPDLIDTIERLIAEPNDLRLARLAGRSAVTEYRPAPRKAGGVEVSGPPG